MIPQPDLTNGLRTDVRYEADAIYTARMAAGASVDNIRQIIFFADGSIRIDRQATVEIPIPRQRPYQKPIIVSTKLIVSPEILAQTVLGMRGWVADLYNTAINRAYETGNVAGTIYAENERTEKNWWPRDVSLRRIHRAAKDRNAFGPKILTGGPVREQPTIFGDTKGALSSFDPICVLGIGLIPIIDELRKRSARVIKESMGRAQYIGAGTQAQSLQHTEAEQFKPAQLRLTTRSFAVQFCTTTEAGQILTVIAFAGDARLQLPPAEIAREFAISRNLDPKNVGRADDQRLMSVQGAFTTMRVRAGLEQAVKMAYESGMLSEQDDGFARMQIGNYRRDRMIKLSSAANPTIPAAKLLTGPKSRV